MALSSLAKRTLRVAIANGPLADSICTKIDTPLSELSANEQRALRTAIPSTSLFNEIAAKLLIPSAATVSLSRGMRIIAANRITGEHIASEIGS